MCFSVIGQVEPLNVDHDSESGCSGSYTDSGRGGSEEGDHNFRGHDESRSEYPINNLTCILALEHLICMFRISRL